ncbi:hypothetical protein C8R45DRAFT_1110581 [Mycena sanguinolenta]|nr:hypothetical protein C8R45DRAFT_1110581 [Mycena sanguinolenta]
MSMNADEPMASADAATTVLAYHKATTSVIYGLPPFEEYQILNAYNVRFTAEAVRSGDRPFVTYDLCCQFYQNLHAIEDTNSHTDSDDSIFGADDPDNDCMPMLEPLSPSSTENETEAASSAVPTTVLSGFVPASRIWAAANADGEGVERDWTSGASQAMQTESASGEKKDGSVHLIWLITLHGARDVDCDCEDGQHATHVQHQVYAFRDPDGNLVIKKNEDSIVTVELT